MGHFCKDEEYRDHLVDSFEHTVKCLIYIATHCAPCGALMGKCLFALKQLCAAKNDVKRFVGPHILKPLCQDVFMDADTMRRATPEFMNYVMQLLLVLASMQDNCVLLEEVGIEQLLKALEKVPASKATESFESNAKKLSDLVQDTVAKQVQGG